MARKHHRRSAASGLDQQISPQNPLVPGMSRREFLHATCGAVAASAMASTVWDLRMINAAFAQQASAAAVTDHSWSACSCSAGTTRTT